MKTLEGLFHNNCTTSFYFEHGREKYKFVYIRITIAKSNQGIAFVFKNRSVWIRIKPSVVSIFEIYIEARFST